MGKKEFWKCSMCFRRGGGQDFSYPVPDQRDGNQRYSISAFELKVFRGSEEN